MSLINLIRQEFEAPVQEPKAQIELICSSAFSYLHDNEEDEGDEHVDLRVLPGLGVPDVVELLGDAVFGPRAVVQ